MSVQHQLYLILSKAAKFTAIAVFKRVFNQKMTHIMPLKKNLRLNDNTAEKNYSAKSC